MGTEELLPPIVAKVRALQARLDELKRSADEVEHRLSDARGRLGEVERPRDRTRTRLLDARLRNDRENVSIQVERLLEHLERWGEALDEIAASNGELTGYYGKISAAESIIDYLTPLLDAGAEPAPPAPETDVLRELEPKIDALANATLREDAATSTMLQEALRSFEVPLSKRLANEIELLSKELAVKERQVALQQRIITELERQAVETLQRGDEEQAKKKLEEKRIHGRIKDLLDEECTIRRKSIEGLNAIRAALNR